MTLQPSTLARIAAAAVLFTSSGSAAAAPADELRFLKSPAARELLFTPRRCPADWTTRSGAVTMNAEWEKDPTKPWFIELQREGGRWVEAGLAHDDRDCIAWGLRQLEWGFRQMKNDGSFDCADSFHSASFLVETTSRSLLLIAASPFADEFRQQNTTLLPPLLTCARWLASPANSRAARNQRIYTHRRFLIGCGLMQTSLLSDDPALRRTALDFIRDGVSLQHPDGAFPEKGGHDSSYHAVAMIYLFRILNITPPDDIEPLWPKAADRAASWLVARIDGDGRVSTEGNTRTGAHQETTRSGAAKGVNFREVAHALLAWHQRSPRPELPGLAARVLAADIR
jgi:hypothetical protein